MARGVTVQPYQPANIRTPGVPGGGFQTIDTGQGDFGQVMAQGLRQTAQDLKGAEAIVQRYVDRDNDAAAADVDAQARRAITQFLTDPDKGFLTKQGRHAIDAQAPAAEELERLRAQFKSMGKNRDQQLMIDKVVGTRFDGALETVMSHTRVQRLAWQTTTFQARADNAQADAIAGADSDTAILTQLNVGAEALDALLDARGLGGEAKLAAMRKWRGDTLQGVLEKKMVGNPDAAIGWYERNKKLFDPADQPAIEAKLKVAREGRDVLTGSQSWTPPGWGPVTGGVRVTDTVVEGDPRAIPRQYAAQVEAAAVKHGVPIGVLAARFYNESRYRADARNPGDQNEINPATGKRFDSVGIGQFGEQLAKRMGFDPLDANASIDQAAKLLADHAKRYGGNWALATLAYGMGAGGVDNWLKKGGDPASLNDDIKRFVGMAMTGKDGPEAIRATLAMGQNLAGALTASGAVTPADVKTTARPEPRLSDAMAEVERRYGNADPVLKEKARAQYAARFEQIHREWRDGVKRNVDAAVTWVYSNRGVPVSQMPPSLMLALDLEQQEKIKVLARTAAKRDEADIPDDTFYKLHGMATSGDANVRKAFADLNLLLERGSLTKERFEKLTSMQGEIRKGDPDGNIAGERNFRQMQDDTIRSVLKLDPSPKEGTEAAADVAAFRRAADMELARATREKGRKLTIEEQQKIIDDLVKPVAGTGGLLSRDVARFKLKPADVPREVATGWDKVFSADKLGPVPDAFKVTMFAAMQAEPAMQAKPDEVAAVTSWIARTYGEKAVTETAIINGWRMLQRRRVATGPIALPGGVEPAPSPTSKDFGAVEVPNAAEPPPVNPRELGQRSGIERAARRWWQGVLKP